MEYPTPCWQEPQRGEVQTTVTEPSALGTPGAPGLETGGDLQYSAQPCLTSQQQEHLISYQMKIQETLSSSH